MEDLIRRSDAIAILKDLQSKHLQFCLVPFRIAIEKVQAIPSADRPQDDDWEKYSDKLWKNAYERGKADRPQGYWTKTDVATYKCSECGKTQIADDINELNFCCCCGSRNKVRRVKGVDDE